MKTFDITIFGIIFLIVGLFAIGWCSNELYKAYKSERTVAGLWLNNYNYSSAMEKAYSLDNAGEWVCVNIDNTITYPEAYDTCVHECSHSAYSEIFARQCENDFSKCKILIEETTKDE